MNMKNMCSSVLGIVLHKPAMQSSTYYQNKVPYIAALAVDGNADPEFWNGHYSSTLSTYEPWWAVKLQTCYTVLNIILSKQTREGTYVHWLDMHTRVQFIITLFLLEDFYHIMWDNKFWSKNMSYTDIVSIWALVIIIVRFIFD